MVFQVRKGVPGGWPSLKEGEGCGRKPRSSHGAGVHTKGHARGLPGTGAPGPVTVAVSRQRQQFGTFSWPPNPCNSSNVISG